MKKKEKKKTVKKVKPPKEVVELHKRIFEAVQQVYEYAPLANDWPFIKQNVRMHMSTQDQTLFSTRDPITKKQNFNEFERVVVNCWENKTGLVVDLSKVNVKTSDDEK